MVAVTQLKQRSADTERFLQHVASALGADAVSVSEESLTRYGENTLPGGDRVPGGIVYPRSTEEVQTIVRLANEHATPLYPISTGANIGLGSRSPVAAGQVVVDLGRHMNRILEVNDTLGYCVVEPGVTFQAMYDELVRRNSRLMMSPTNGPAFGGLLGNALDKGGGSGPLADHFGSLCGLEIVLGNGDIIRTGDGALQSEKLLNWHASKYSFGPYLDGLFTQSNFGIVTRAGIWMMPRPPAIRTFYFTFPDDDDFGEIIDLIRPLKSNNFVPTLMRATNDLYLVGSYDTNPEYPSTGGKTALSLEGRRALQKKWGLGAWTASGAFYGPNQDVLKGQVERVIQHFTKSGKARYIDHETAETIAPLRVSIAGFSGIPSSGELGLLSWRPGGGALWFLPGTPMISEVANECHHMTRRVCEEHGFEYLVSNVCNARFARGVHSIIFNRNDPEETERAGRCYWRLAEEFARRGISVGRIPTVYQGRHNQQRMPSVVNACNAIKLALDPNNIIAPGKYGIG